MSLRTRLRKWRASIRSIRESYEYNLGYRPHIFQPQAFGEKIQWRKLFDDNPLFTILSDKYAVREFIQSRGFGDRLIPLLWVGDNPEQIPFDDLAPPFVIKSTHGWANVIIVDQRPYDVEGIIRQTKEWLEYCHGTAKLEPGYIQVPKRLIIERKLGGDVPPDEYKLFTFDGIARVINFVKVMPDRSRETSFHLPNWERLAWVGMRPPLKETPPKPENLDQLIAVAEALAAGFDHLRADFYGVGSQIYVGELTLYSGSGFTNFRPDSAQAFLGAHWKLRRPLRRALKRMLTTDWGFIRPS